MRIFGIVMLWAVYSCANVLDFDLIKMPSENPKKPLALIIGGIQGDEPGGFNAANLFLQHYKIVSGEVWVIPNLNRHSILRNHRGIYGDMNRKFKQIDQSDQEYKLVERLKQIIKDDRVSIVYHLHDGSGFYRQNYVSHNLNPNRWGNCSIIDQEKLEDAEYVDLAGISKQVVENINSKVLKDLHTYHIRNTRTELEDREMQKSLTYFAVRNKKTALANEASKDLPVAERVYYHLLGIEGMLKAVGIAYQRDFELSPKEIARFINNQDSWVKITPLIKLPLFGLRKTLNFFPLPKQDLEKLALESNHYIVGLLQRDKGVSLKYGNRVMSTFSPLQIEFAENAPREVEFIIDGKRVEVENGGIVKVEKNFEVVPREGMRVNVIGFSSSQKDEAGIKIAKQQIAKRYSIDVREKKYRVEFYEEDRFAGMVIVDFDL